MTSGPTDGGCAESSDRKTWQILAPFRKSIIAKHSTTLGFVNMAEENVEDVLAAGHGDVLGPRFKANQGENTDKRSNCS